MFDSILTSLATSVIVSSTTFIWGLRVGKNQADRPKLKEYYRNITVYFTDLYTCIEQGTPKSWNDFDNRINTNAQKPVVTDMVKNGTILELPDTLAQSIQKLENEILFFGSEYRKMVDCGFEKAIEHFKKSALPLIHETEYQIGGGQIGTAYWEVYIGELFSENRRKLIIDQLSLEPDEGIALYSNLNDKAYTIYITQYELGMTVHQYINELCRYLLGEFVDPKKIDESKELLDKLDKILPLLKNRVKDPHPFWQTVRMAFNDVFGGK